MIRNIFPGKNLSITVEKDGKRTLLRSIHIKILVFWVLIGLSAVAMRPVQYAVSQEMLNIRTKFIGKLETLTGLEIRYSSLRPAFFGSFDIKNLRFMKGETSFFTVSRVKIYFSISELLFRKKTFIHTVLIERPMIRIDTAKDSSTLDYLSSLLKNNGSVEKDALRQIASFLPKEADYQIRNCYFYMIDGETICRVENMDFDLKESSGSILLNGKFGAEYRHNGLFDKTIIIKTDVDINGVCLNNLESGKADIVFSNLSGSELDIAKKQASFFSPPVNRPGSKTLFTVRSVNAALSYLDGIIKLYRPKADESADYNFSYDIEKRTADAELNFNDFVLGNKITFSDQLKNADHLLSMRITGNSMFSLKENGAVDYSVNLKGGNTAALSDGFLIDFRGDDKSISVNDFRLSASANTAKAGLFKGSMGFSGKTAFSPFLPSGTVFFDSFSLYGGEEDINAVFRLSSSAKEIKIASERLSIARTHINNFDISLYPSDKDVGINVSGFLDGDSAVYLDAVYNKNPNQLEASLALVSLSMYDISEIFHPFADSINTHTGQGYLKNILIDADIFLSTDFNNIIYNAPNLTFTKGDTKGTFSLAGTDEQITLSEGTVIIDGNEFLVSANMYFSNPMDFVFSFNASYLDLSWNIEGQILDRTTLIIRDPNGLHVYGNISNSGALSGYIEGIDYPVWINSRTVYLNFYSTVRFNSPDFWNLDVNHFTAGDFNSGGSDYLKMTGSADQDGASFRNILYSDSIGELAGSVDFSWDTDFSYFEFLANVTDGRENGEFYFLEGSLRDEHINVRASVNEMRADRFMKGNGMTLVSAEAVVYWESINSFNAKLDLTSFYGRMQNDTVQGSVIVNFSNDELLVSDLNLDYSGVKTFFPELLLNRAEGIVKADGNIQGSTKGKEIEGEINLNANFSPADSWLEISQAFNNFDGNLQFKNILYGDSKQELFDFVFSGNEGAVSLSGGTRDMIRLEMDAEGNFFAGLSSPMPIRGSVIGTYKGGMIDSHVNNFFIDMQSLWALVGQGQDFSIAGGYITGEMDIRGPVLNPEFYGSGMGSSLRFQLPGYINKDIRPVPFNILAEGYEMSFGPVVLAAGSGGGTVDGWFLFENWAPVNIGLELSIPKESPVPYDFNIAGFLANGNASGDLNVLIDVNDSMIELSGALFTNDAEMGLRMDEIGRFSDVEYHSVVEISVTTGSMAEFIWPNTGSPILRANPENGTVFHVFSDTQAGQFSLDGNVKIRSGELYYFDRNFYIRQGNIVFRENERQFDPRLSARAEIRDRAESGMATISMIIENQPLFSFEPRFEANPTLTQLEIYSILGQNLNDIQGYENTDMAQRFLLASTTDILTQVVANSDVFGQIVFVRQFEKQIRDILHLDMFSVRTRFLQNAVVSGVMSPIDGSNRVGNYFDNTTVFIGKYIGQDMFVQGMLKMKYDENSNLFGGLVLEPDIGIELQSPFVNIRWDFFPNHPENWWVNDNSITLSWSKYF
jgi:hypothetical protein